MYTGAVTTTAYRQGPAPVVLNDIQCVGGETRLVDCRASTITARDCSGLANAGVICLQRTGIVMKVKN